MMVFCMIVIIVIIKSFGQAIVYTHTFTIIYTRPSPTPTRRDPLLWWSPSRCRMTSVTTAAASPRPSPPASPCATPITPPPESPSPTSSSPVSLLDFATVFDDEYDDAFPVDLGLLRLVGEACPPPPKRACPTVAPVPVPVPVAAGGNDHDDDDDDAAGVVRAWLATYYPDEVVMTVAPPPDATAMFWAADQTAATATTHAPPPPTTPVRVYWVRAHVAADAQFDTVLMARDPAALHASLDADLPELPAVCGRRRQRTAPPPLAP